MTIERFMQNLDNAIKVKGYKMYMADTTKTPSFFCADRLYRGKTDIYFSLYFNGKKLYLNKIDKSELINKYNLTF